MNIIVFVKKKKKRYFDVLTIWSSVRLRPTRIKKYCLIVTDPYEKIFIKEVNLLNRSQVSTSIQECVEDTSIPTKKRKKHQTMIYRQTNSTKQPN